MWPRFINVLIGIWLTAAPDLLFFRDDDGDGVADRRRVVLTGFHAGNQQLRVNGPALRAELHEPDGEERPTHRRGTHADGTRVPSPWSSMKRVRD